MSAAGFCCVLVMQATSSPLAAEVTPAWLGRCAEACSTQLARDVAPVYGGVYGVRVASSATDVQPGELVFAILDSLPDAPGAIAYHDVAGGDVPVAFLALSTCSTLDDVSTAISHELCETAGDASCNLWADDGTGHEWARELCDAVESNSYPIDLGDGQPPVNVSDFLLPSFFGAGASPPYSYMQGTPSPATATAGFPSSPFSTAPAGYQIERSSGTGETQVTGSAKGKKGALAFAGAHHWSSRTARRGVARAL